MTKRFGFTLAEVLITLGIIGVVAAITMPTLIQNHQKASYVAGLKKAYAFWGNTFAKIASDNEITDWTRLACASAESYETCFDDISKVASIIKSEKNSGSYSLGNGTHQFYSFTTPDGIKHIYYSVNEITAPYGANIEVDVNGDKGPNLYGRDKFYLDADFANSKVILKNNPNKPPCEPAAYVGSTTVFCAAQIAENGWKMDY